MVEFDRKSEASAELSLKNNLQTTYQSMWLYCTVNCVARLGSLEKDALYKLMFEANMAEDISNQTFICEDFY